MLKIKGLLIYAVLFFALGTNAQSVLTTTFEVGGNCGMCKKRIEAAAQGKGVLKAEWNMNTKKMSLEYDSKKTSAAKVQKRIAASGHDTTFVQAKNKVYDKLPGCCQYDRLKFSETPTRASDGHNHVH